MGAAAEESGTAPAAKKKKKRHKKKSGGDAGDGDEKGEEELAAPASKVAFAKPKRRAETPPQKSDRHRQTNHSNQASGPEGDNGELQQAANAGFESVAGSSAGHDDAAVEK